MKLILLGSGGYYPNDQRHTACIWIPDYGLVLDAGTGMYRLNQLATPSHYDVLLSHAHLDHVIGLTYLLPTLLKSGGPSMHVYGTRSTLDAVSDHLFAPPLFPVTPPLKLVELSNPFQLASGVAVCSASLEHPGGSTGYRLDFPHGRSVGYITDTTARRDAPYVELIRDCDLLIHECYFGDAQQKLAEQTGHSYQSEVAAVARAAGCRRVILVHLNPFGTASESIDLEAMQREVGSVELGRDMMELTV